MSLKQGKPIFHFINDTLKNIERNSFQKVKEGIENAIQESVKHIF